MINISVNYNPINLAPPIKNLIDKSITITTKQKKRPKVADKLNMPKKAPTREGATQVLTLSHLFL